MPVPYNMQFELSIMTKLNDDALQIVEQILPYFQPAFSISVQLVDSIQERRDIPVVLENITMQDDYEGDFTTRRVLLYTLRFTAKTYLFGPTASASDIIKKSTINYLSGTLQLQDREQFLIRSSKSHQRLHWRHCNFDRSRDRGRYHKVQCCGWN